MTDAEKALLIGILRVLYQSNKALWELNKVDPQLLKGLTKIEGLINAFEEIES